MGPDRPGGVWGEIEALRAWRHEKVTPELASLRGRLQALEKRMDVVEPEVEKMASQAKIEAAVSSALRKERGQLLTRGQKIIVGIGSTTLFVIAVADFVHGFIS